MDGALKVGGQWKLVPSIHLRQVLAQAVVASPFEKFWRTRGLSNTIASIERELWSDDGLSFVLVASATGQLLGLYEMTDHSQQDRCAQLSVLPLTSTGKGVFEGAVVFLDYSIARMGLRRVYSSLVEESADAWGSSLQSIFNLEGRLAQHVWAAGRFQDVLLFGSSTEELNSRLAASIEFRTLTDEWHSTKMTEMSEPEQRLSELLRELRLDGSFTVGECADSLELVQIEMLMEELTDGAVAIGAIEECRDESEVFKIVAQVSR